MYFNSKNRKDVTDPIFNLESDELGLYMQRYLPISSCIVKPIKVSGLMYHITDQIEEEELYCSELKYMFEEAENAKYIYDEAVNGPSRFIRSEISRTFRRSVRMDRDEE